MFRTGWHFASEQASCSVTDSTSRPPPTRRAPSEDSTIWTEAGDTVGEGADGARAAGRARGGKAARGVEGRWRETSQPKAGKRREHSHVELAAASEEVGVPWSVCSEGEGVPS